jgi:hypothetical protein
MIDEYICEYYDLPSRTNKSKIIDKIVQTIRNERKGRFLKDADKETFDQDGVTALWVQASEAEARIYVSSVFRNNYRRNSHGAVGAADVLMGKSTNLRLHPGNIFLNQLIAEKFEEYNNLPLYDKTEKTKLFGSIVDTILRGKGRFLKRQGRGPIGRDYDTVPWELASKHEARVKVASGFRWERRSRRNDIFSLENHNALK